MNRNEIVINMLAFEQEMSNQKRQSYFFENISRLGLHRVEVRREFFCNFDDFHSTREESKKHGLELLYSVPLPLFVRGRLDRAMLNEIAREAETLDVRGIKWICGEFSHWDSDDVAYMLEFAHMCPRVLTVENDQTKCNGTMQNMYVFLDASRRLNIPLGATFDIGNWSWVNQNPVDNAQRLFDFVRYIHVKDVVQEQGGPRAVPVGQGQLPLKDIMNHLPKDVLIALEYPCGAEALSCLEEGVNWLLHL